MSRKQKRMLRNIIIALSLFLIVLILDLVLKNAYKDTFPYGIASFIPNENYGWLLPFGLYFLIYIFIGHNVLRKSVINIAHGQVFDENFLMAIATLGAFSLGIYTGITEHSPEGFDEACAVLLFYQVGEWFQSYAAGKSRKSITELMDIRPDYANLVNGDLVEKVDPSIVSLGSIIAVSLAPIIMTAIYPNVYYICYAALCAIYVIIKHKDNIKRLLNGTENKVRK